jgi:hypothetical protein
VAVGLIPRSCGKLVLSIVYGMLACATGFTASISVERLDE